MHIHDLPLSGYLWSRGGKNVKCLSYTSYKVPYKNLSTSQMELYTDPITPMLFSTFFGAAIGYMRMDDSEAEL